jgi:hypothetical protein
MKNFFSEKLFNLLKQKIMYWKESALAYWNLLILPCKFNISFNSEKTQNKEEFFNSPKKFFLPNLKFCKISKNKGTKFNSMQQIPSK